MAEAAPLASYAEHLALEAESEEKHEYVDGREALYLASLEGSLSVDALYADALS